MGSSCGCVSGNVVVVSNWIVSERTVHVLGRMNESMSSIILGLSPGPETAMDCLLGKCI